VGDDPAEGRHIDLKLGSSAQVGRNLEALMEAALRRKRVSMKYNTISRDETNSREIDPYGLGHAGHAWNSGAWYVVGYCHLRKALRVFKLDRIRGSVKIHAPDSDEPDFKAPEGFNIRDHLNKARWEMAELAQAFGGGPVASEDVLVRFPSGVASAIRELVPSAEVVEGAETSSTVLRFHIKERRAFCRFLLPYVEQLEIVAPRDLEDALAELAREILKRYDESPVASPAAHAPAEPGASP
jgi:proteasome accessory factor B